MTKIHSSKRTAVIAVIVLAAVIAAVTAGIIISKRSAEAARTAVRLLDRRFSGRAELKGLCGQGDRSKERGRFYS